MHHGVKNHSRNVRAHPRDGESAWERLGSQEKTSVADRLLSETSIKKIYVDDIVHCVADMIPEMPESQRLAFVLKVCRFLTSGDNFNGKETFAVLRGPLLACLNPDERKLVAETLADGVRTDHVSRCQAHVWGLSYTLPALSPEERKKHVLDLLSLGETPSLQDWVHDALVWLVFSLERDNRLDVAYGIAERLARGGTKSFKRFILGVLNDLTGALDENDRTTIADLAAPMVFDTDAPLATAALKFFGRNWAALPGEQRYSYALLVAGILKDPTLHDEAVETLTLVASLLPQEAQREHVERLLENDGEGAGSPRGGGNECGVQHVYMNREPN